MNPQVSDDFVLRPEVLALARAMEEKLRKHDHKGGWQEETTRHLLDRARDEIEELDQAVSCATDRHCTHLGSEAEKLKAVLAEAADVANFAMMTADVCGALYAGPLLAPRPVNQGTELANARLAAEEAPVAAEANPAAVSAKRMADALCHGARLDVTEGMLGPRGSLKIQKVESEEGASFVLRTTAGRFRVRVESA